MNKKIYILIISIFFLIPLYSFADTITLQPADKETYINSNSVNTNYYHANDYCPLIRYTGYHFRCLYSFDLSSIPAGATINSATTSLYYYGYTASDPNGTQVNLCKQTRNNWLDTEATWNNYKTGSSWTSAGGDIGSCVNNTFPATVGHWINFDSTSEVQSSYATSSLVNYILMHNTENTGDYEPTFYASNYTGNTTLRPKLLIDYTPTTTPSSGNSSSSLKLNYFSTQCDTIGSSTYCYDPLKAMFGYIILFLLIIFIAIFIIYLFYHQNRT